MIGRCPVRAQAGARLLERSGERPREQALSAEGEGLEAWREPLEPPPLERGELSGSVLEGGISVEELSGNFYMSCLRRNSSVLPGDEDLLLISAFLLYSEHYASPLRFAGHCLYVLVLNHLRMPLVFV